MFSGCCNGVAKDFVLLGYDTYLRRTTFSYNRSVQGKLKTYGLVTWNMCDLYVMAAYTHKYYILMVSE